MKITTITPPKPDINIELTRREAELLMALMGRLSPAFIANNINAGVAVSNAAIKDCTLDEADSVSKLHSALVTALKIKY